MRKLTYLLIIIALGFASCEKDRGVNLFTVNQDIEFGETMDAQIRSNPTEFPILDKNEYPQAYAYMNNMMTELLKSEKFKYADRFKWEITIIDKDVMNAFAVPGGKMYFYTGLLKYLDDGASLSGVLGHEMAHIDLRHSTRQLTNAYGFEILLQIITGNEPSELEKIAGQLASGVASLQFSKKNEYAADRYAMYYNATTDFHPKGIQKFFVKLLDQGKDENNFTFLSTHPSDQARIDEINLVYQTDDYIVSNKDEVKYDYHLNDYNAFLSGLPN